MVLFPLREGKMGFCHCWEKSAPIGQTATVTTKMLAEPEEDNVLFGGLCVSLNNAFVHTSSQNIGNEMRKDFFSRIMAWHSPFLNLTALASVPAPEKYCQVCL
jgi:hypothetical protein